jgi:heme exporter protein D
LEDNFMARRLLDLKYESRGEPLLSRAAFAGRMVASCAAAVVLIAVSLLGGMCGYRYFEGMTWIDAYANASMILSGMGPLTPLNTWAGKFFAGTYALYSGLALILATGFIIAPVVHRVMHRFHLESERDEEQEKDRAP